MDTHNFLSTLLATLLLTLLSVSSVADMAKPSLNKEEFCINKFKKNYFKNLAFEPSNQLAFENEGGLFGGGVCWWHSLFQRSAIYLVVFRPELPKPDQAQAKKIIHMIAYGERVVEIPGYSNLWEFSKNWEKEIQAKLEAWQKVDGFLNFAWVNGLSGSTNIEPHEMFTRLTALQKSVEIDGNIEWTMFQLAGVTAHAGLFLGLTNANKKFSIQYLDSNYVGVTSWLIYLQGDRSIKSHYGSLVPYVGRQKDLIKFKKAAHEYCASVSKDWPIPENAEDNPLNNDLE